MKVFGHDRLLLHTTVIFEGQDDWEVRHLTNRKKKKITELKIKHRLLKLICSLSDSPSKLRGVLNMVYHVSIKDYLVQSFKTVSTFYLPKDEQESFCGKKQRTGDTRGSWLYSTWVSLQGYILISGGYNQHIWTSQFPLHTVLLITTIFILLCGFKMSIMKKACVLKECICLIMVRFILDFANRSFSGKVHLPAALKLSLI